MPDAMFFGRFLGLPGQGQYAASQRPPPSAPEHPPDLILQYFEIVYERVRGGEVAAMDLLEDAEIQHVHQRCRVSALARRLERLLRIGQCGVGIAEQQQIQRPPGEDRGADLLSEARC